MGFDKYGKMILPDGKYYSMDDMKTRLNNNVMVIGTTGCAKTRTVVTPNLLECVGSYVVTDPKGNLYKKWGKYMENNGYRVVRISFVHPEESVHYNPLDYINTTQQIQQMSSILIDTQENKVKDPFWDESAQILLNSIIAYIKEFSKYMEFYFETKASKGFQRILELLRMSERNQYGISELGRLMSELRENYPISWAYKQFQSVTQAADRTYRSIVISAIAKLGTFDTEELSNMMEYDEIDIRSIGKQKTAVFVEVSDSDRSMDKLINLFFTQVINQLCTFADEECENNQLPVPVRFIMDDFATNCKIINFDKMISNIRSRKISVILTLQSFAQLESCYGRASQTIIDDCDTLIYMGGNSTKTASEIAVRCDKTVQSILRMPLCSSWILRRGETPFLCKNMELDDYLRDKKIVFGMQEESTNTELEEREAV